MKDWDQSEAWIKKFDLFSVQVKHWVYNGENKWNVYIYLFPKFPKYDEFKEDIMTWIPVSMNWGNTYVNWTRNEKGEITCKCYGSDYMHIHQERFKGYATKEEAFSVFADAEENIRELENWCAEALEIRST